LSVTTEKKTRIGRLFSDGRRVDEALMAAARQAALLHEKKGVPLVVWRDGKTTLVSPAALRRALRIKKN
jgi:hypothetical protein